MPEPTFEFPLSAPFEFWCPRCQLHLRSQDYYGQKADHILKPLCPVCADDDRLAALAVPA